MSPGEEMFGKLVQLAADGIIITDSELRIIAWNRGTERIFGLSPAELDGRRLPDLMPAGAGEGIEKRLAERPGRGEPGLGDTFDAIFKKKDGTEVHVEHTVASWESGGKKYFGAIMRDITEWENAKTALALSEAKYRSLVDNAAFGIATLDVDGALTYVNDALCRIGGYSRYELLCKPFSEFLHPEDEDRIVELFKSSFKEPAGQVSLEFRMLRKDDSIAYCYSSQTATRRGNEIVSFNAVIQDITELKHAQEALRESEESFRNLAEQSPNMIFINVRGHVAYANRRCEEIMGYTREEFYSPDFDFLSITAPEYRELVSNKFRTHMSGKEVAPYEYALIAKNGRRLETLMSPKLINYCGETAILGTITDITERNKAERALQSSEERFRTLFEKSPVGVVLIDLEGTILDINEAAIMLHDRPRSSVVGKKFTELGTLYEDDVRRYFENFRRLVGGETLQPIEVRLRSDRGDRWQEISSALLEKDGEIEAIQVIMRDITDRKLAQKEMMGRLMDYDLEEGNIYMVKESAPVLSLEGFRDLLRAGYRGAALSRTPTPRFKEDTQKLFEFRWLSEKHSAESISPDLARIEKWLEGLPRNTAVLIERVDYLVLKNGVPRTRQFVHAARDLAHLMGHIIILSVDPAAVGSQVLEQFQKETMEIVPRARPHLPEDLLSMLKHVYQQNAVGIRPTMTEVREALGLSKPTTSKRANNLVHSGYLVIAVRGRTKVVELTEKGRRVFLT
jgi:PAS domain S-box-containing protein